MNLTKAFRCARVRDGVWRPIGAGALAIWCILGAMTMPGVQAQEGGDKQPAGEVKAKPGGASQQDNLMDVIKELQDEVKQLRRELNQLKAERGEGRRGDEESAKRRPRDGEGVEREGPRDGDGIERREGRNEEGLARRESKSRDRAGKRHRENSEAVELHSAGVIKEVAPEGKAQEITVSVNEDGKEMELVCRMGEGTRITLNDKPAQYEDLKAGDHVECEYILKGDNMIAVARAITAKRGAMVGQEKP